MARTRTFNYGQNSTTEVDASNGAAATIQTTTVRSGTYAGRVNNPASGTRTGWGMRTVSGAAINQFFRFYLYVATRPNVRTTILCVANTATLTDNATAYEGTVELNTDGTLTLAYWDFNGATRTQVGSASSALTNGQWYLIEIHYDPSGGGGSNVFQGKLEGTQFAGSTTLSFGGLSNIRWGANLLAETCTTLDIFFADFAVNDSTGSAPHNTYPGAGSTAYLFPDGAGDFAEGAVTGAATSWQAVSEIPPDDATSYHALQTDSSANSSSADRLDVTVGNMPAASAVALVQVGARVKPATNAACSFVPRIKTQASGTVVEGTTTSITGTAWVTHDDTAGSKQYKLTSVSDPQGGGAWTDTLVNGMQIGIRAPDGAPDVQVTSLWAVVDYTPAAPVANVPPEPYPGLPPAIMAM